MFDTHAHIHFDDYAGQLESIFANAQAAGVDKILTVGVDSSDSAKAVEFASGYPNVWATVGLHPHDAKLGMDELSQIAELAKSPKVVAIGECGLDYYRNLSSKTDQEAALKFQIELALSLDKPLVFHVRDPESSSGRGAFEDFFSIVDSYSGIQGVVHCFTSTEANAKKAVDRGLFVALNGIMTFTKDQTQLDAAKSIPLSHLVLETDCPFLTPAPKRGQMNEPANLELTAKFLAELRGEDFGALARQTSANALRLFGL